MTWIILATLVAAVAVIVIVNLRHPREVSPPVLCRDCKYGRETDGDFVWCMKHGRGMNEIDFCEEGEKDDENRAARCR